MKERNATAECNSGMQQRNRTTEKKSGRVEGEKKKQIEIAKEMLKEGMDIKLIAKIAKLTEEEIKNIEI